MNHKKTALFGGTFDPVHNGHIRAAVQIRKKLGTDRVVLMPNYRNPLKPDGTVADTDARLKMLSLAVSGIEGVEVSEIETERQAASYTADTLRLWRARETDGQLWFVMGTDLFSSVAGWKNFAEIFEKTNIAVISRPGTRAANQPPFEIRNLFLYDKKDMETVRFTHKSGALLWFVKIDAPAVSSTEIRSRVKSGGEFADMVPRAVGEFIRQNKIYC